MSQSTFDRALGRQLTQGILIYVVEDENAEVKIPTDYYYEYHDVFVKKGNKAWKYGIGSAARFSDPFRLYPHLEIPLSDFTKMMLWDNAKIVRL